jgi:ATP-dependent Clp endopeptidase proteolytic subunit ClpP
MTDTTALPAVLEARVSETKRAPTAEEAAKTIAETEKLRAEIAKINAEVMRAQADAETATHMAAVARIARDERERDELALLAGNDYNRVYLFNGVVSESSVKLAINRLTEWHRLYPKQDIQIVFTSGGGSVVDGMALFDFILGLRRQGHKVTTSTLGMAASMAGILLQAGDVRTMGKQAWLMIHEASFHTEGKIGEVEDTVEWIKKVQERVLDIFAERSTMPREEIKDRWLRRNWWIDSDNALELGFVDVIL